MELINYAYMSVIAIVIFTAMAYVQSDLSANYPSLTSDSGGTWANSSINIQNLTNSTSLLSSSIGNATNSSLTYTTGDSGIAQAFGYLLGLFNAMQALIKVPAIMLSVSSILVQSLGIFLPSWVFQFIILAIMIGFLVSILYYISKVK